MEKVQIRDWRRQCRNGWKHFRLISRHKWKVFIYCSRVGLVRQGLLHDMTKFSWTEFRTGIFYYAGIQSPNTAERLEQGVSEAWLHHKGRNKHHYEYWIDYSVERPGELCGCRMPYRYVAEMFCDRVSASQIYKGAAYTDAAPYEYFAPHADRLLIHPQTRRELLQLLELLRDEGETAALDFLREEIRRRRRDSNGYF